MTLSLDPHFSSMSLWRDGGGGGGVGEGFPRCDLDAGDGGAALVLTLLFSGLPSVVPGLGGLRAVPPTALPPLLAVTDASDSS